MSPAVAGDGSPSTTVELSVAGMATAVVSAGLDAADLIAVPSNGARSDRDAETAAYLRRLVVAAVFFVPLSALSVPLSLFPAQEFAGWQWALLVLAAPVTVWAAWPFHRAAVVNARHGECSMDTLVSLGVAAACGWSVFAMFVLDRGSVRVSAWYELMHASGGGIYLEVAASLTTFLLAGRFY